MIDNGRFTPQSAVETPTLPSGNSSLKNASIEVSLSSSSIYDRTLGEFNGTGRRFMVMAQPDRPIEKVLDLASKLHKGGFDVVPHLGAMEVRGAEHLGAILQTTQEHGINDIFVVKGEGQPGRGYRTSLAMMKDMEKMGMGYDRIGIAGYPEGVLGMDEESIMKGIILRQQVADSMGSQLYIVTQMCFDPARITRYIQNLRERGVDAPVVVGLAAPLNNETVYNLAARCGVPDSKNVLLQKPEKDFKPEELVEGIDASGGDSLVSGYHMYSFNKVEAIRGWLDSLT